jgi:hypothetical protein
VFLLSMLLSILAVSAWTILALVWNHCSWAMWSNVQSSGTAAERDAENQSDKQIS